MALAGRAQQASAKFVLFIFPEGTLVSPDTRPISTKYAEKIGVVSDLTIERQKTSLKFLKIDLEHTLLPRSTGLMFCLRTLGPAIRDLQLMDVSIGYPGIPPDGYGQDYYTLRSIFLNGIPPPQVHVHIRYFKVEDIPLGELSVPHSIARGVEVSADEATQFDAWLRDRWIEKDRMLKTFYREGAFRPEAGQKWTLPVEIPVKLRHPLEHLQAYSFFLPFIVWYGWKALKLGIHKLVYN